VDRPAKKRIGDVGRLSCGPKIAGDHLLGTPRRIRPYQTLGDLHVEMGHEPVAGPDGEPPEAYRRRLDLRSGVAGVEYPAGGRTVRRECFASQEDDLLALRIEPAEGTVSTAVTVDRPQDARSATEDNRLRLRGGVVDVPEEEAGPGG